MSIAPRTHRRWTETWWSDRTTTINAIIVKVVLPLMFVAAVFLEA